MKWRCHEEGEGREGVCLTGSEGKGNNENEEDYTNAEK